MPKANKRRLSLVGKDGAESLADGMARRSSQIAVLTQEKVNKAPADKKLVVLFEGMRTERQKRDLMDPEFASWALSCVSELAQGHPENRKKLTGLGICDLLMDFMEFFPDDIYVQWQGCDALSSMSADHDAADKFGRRGLDCVIRCMANTAGDVSELGFTGIRAFKNLVENSERNLKDSAINGASDVIRELMNEFPTLNQFQFAGERLILFLDACPYSKVLQMPPKEYLEEYVSPVLHPIVQKLLVLRPNDVIDTMMEELKK